MIYTNIHWCTLMYTLATNIRNWEMKVVRRLNHRENSKKPKKPKEVHQKVSKTIEKTKKNQKNQRFHADPGCAPNVFPPGSAWNLCFFLIFWVFSMVLLTFWWTSFGFLGFFEFSRWFSLRTTFSPNYVYLWSVYTLMCINVYYCISMYISAYQCILYILVYIHVYQCIH